MSNTLSKMPNIPIPLSRFPQKFDHSTSMFHGDLIPIHCFECVPGDKFNYKPSELLRMSTPIVPIMSNIECNLHAVFVPLRLVWDEAEKFYGDPSNHDRISSITPVDPDSVPIPSFKYTDFGAADAGGNWSWYATKNTHSVSDYLGKPDLFAAINGNSISKSDFTDWINAVHVSCLKERAYCVAWNDHFRPSLLVPPILVNKSSSAVNGSMIGTQSFDSANGHGSPTYKLGFDMKPFKVMKKYDYFTANTLSPQFGNSVALPLGTFAPVISTNSTHTGNTEYINLLTYSTSPQPAGNVRTLGLRNNGATSSSTGTLVAGTSQVSSADNWDGTTLGVFASNLWADLSSASSATINQLRFAFQVQKYLERSNYGSKYFEILNAHYGVTNPDSRLQRSLRLGSHKFYINISQVLATNESNDVNLGQTGAVSVTGDSTSLFTADIKEPGYILVLMTTKYERSYSSGFLREDLRSNRFEFYSPEFANLGDQLTKQIEVQIVDDNGALISPATGFGYQEHWAEYRYLKNLTTGELKPGRGLDIWTLADDFDGVDDVVPGYAFLHEDRSALTRCLVTGNNGPDYIVNYRADIIATREMPLYSIPGLIDHFGAL